MGHLTDREILDSLNDLPGWSQAEGKLVRDWEFPDFVQAIRFVNSVAEVAEAEGHHPDIDIRYNKVRLALVSHVAGGITRRDIALALKLTEGFS